ncbi:hypothetical protein HMPREF1624_08027 [Sporothrix schenckii ATCC 58251]|uniref:DUF202 domain-containing protein n=1 Tax=Sporothrix schenckii (strain ATCC 58251 / de Perez 2211183) TaxID=1391915 RepID=U7PKS5_SPOS1|nr:hypothetical protein HMPREF1624_08027 [Sporothrix schenckii ATCC 58251]
MATAATAATAASADPRLVSVPPPTSSSSQPAEAQVESQGHSLTSIPTSTSAHDSSQNQPDELPSIPPPVLSAPSSPRSASVVSSGEGASPASPSSPTTRPTRGASTSSSTGSVGRSGLFNRSLSGIRRQATQDRLDEILEAGTARNRAETYTAAAPSATPPDRNRRATFRMEPLLRNQSAPGAFAGIAEQYESESADETTRINRRDNNSLNYQTTSKPASRSPHSGPRARKPGGNESGQGSQGDGSGGGVPRGGSRAASVRSRTTSAGAPPPPPPSSRWTDFWAGFQSVELENKGSVARDHLALERTFLAWLRTSLAFTSIGIAVTQLFRLNTSTDGSNNNNNNSGFHRLRNVGRPLGTAFLGISVLILFLGYHRYYQSQQWILKGKFPASRGTILLVSLVAFALMVTSLVVVVVVQPT